MTKEQIQWNGIKLLIVGYILFLMWVLSSCGISKRNAQSFTEKVDSTFTQIKKESDQNTKDSATTRKIGQVQTDSSTIHIDFQDNQSDSTAYTNVTIKTDSLGVITINTGGKKIKGITALRKHTEAKNGSDSVHVVSASNTVKIDSTKSDLAKNIKSTEVKKFSFQLPWFVYVIIAVLLVAGWFFWPQIMAAKKLTKEIKIPYSAPKDTV